MKLTGAEIIVEVLIEQGVTDMFGYPGGAALNIFEALYHRQDKIAFYLTAHEQGATHAADGYARATGKTGVVIATSGPGATNTITGIATAYLDSVPMVVITANVGTSLIGKDSFQEVFITGISQPVTKHNYAVRDITRLADTLRDAFKIAGSGRCGPVLIDIPKDITAATCEFTPASKWEEPKAACAPMSELKKVADLIKKAKRPVVCFGGGVISSEAGEELLKFVQKAKIPACHTIMGTGVIGFGDNLDLGMIGMHGSMTANHAIDEADLLLAMGTRFSDRVATNLRDFAPHATIVQFDIDESEIRKNVLVDLAIIGDLRMELQNLIPLVEGRERPEWMETISKWQKEYDIINGKGITGIRPVEIMEVISEKCGDDAVIATDVGQHQMWAAQFCKKTRPRGFLTSGGLGTMGFGYGAAIGAAVALRNATVFHITSDGSFHMNMNEACTAVSNKLKVITVIFDNAVLGMVHQWQNDFYDKHFVATEPERKTDYVKVAEGFGARGFKAQTRAELEKAVDEAIACEGPAWIVCPIDRNEKVLPMIPNGGTVRSAILE
ncbi:MAG: biosynthetic-type acetolactate synthase large subunit [Oscillospiraceae bacterium]|nr:biosynthetic-type acetolactate synthase large subunit [Oscillospiraceae bacterium]